MAKRILVYLAIMLGVSSLLLLSLPPSESQATTLGSTRTPTRTRTATPTRTPTATPCGVAPPAPKQLAPGNGVTIGAQSVALRWTMRACATSYGLIVRRDSPKGRIVVSTNNLQRARFRRDYADGRTYFWSAGACDAIGCTYSGYQSFSIHLPPSPTPTPVPLFNMGRIVNYQGPDVYLNTDPNALYSFDCRWKWRPMNGTVYFGVVGFQPYEQVTVSYLIFNIQGNTYYTTLTADAYGNTQMAWNGSGATLGHYHWTFASRSASYCGHFDHTQ